MRLIAHGNKRGTLYCLSRRTLLDRFIVLAKSKDVIKLWHKKWGHVSQKGFNILTSFHELVVKGTELDFWYFYGKSSHHICAYDHPHIFACEPFVQIEQYLRSKMAARSMKGIFLGYSEKAEMLYWFWFSGLKKWSEVEISYLMRESCYEMWMFQNQRKRLSFSKSSQLLT